MAGTSAERIRRLWVLGNGVAVRPLGTRQLQGFDDPIEVYALDT